MISPTEKFYNELKISVDIDLEMSSEEEGATKEKLFTNKIIDDLSRGNSPAIRGRDSDSFRWANSRGEKINSFSLDDVEHSIVVYVTQYVSFPSPTRMLQPEVEAMFKSLNAFMQRIVNDSEALLDEIEEDFPLYSLVYTVSHHLNEYDTVSYVLLTNCQIGEIKTPSFKFNGIRVDNLIFDIERYRRYMDGQRDIVVDATPDLLGNPVPAVAFTGNSDDYDTYCCVLPGEVIYRLFDTYHYQLLNSNVRTYLQLRGSVNQGIMNTIERKPSSFLAYNNGISATASALIMNEKQEISEIKDFQIVNGGQTSASIYNAKAKKNLDIRSVAVMTKITVIRNEAKRDEIVKNISRYANTQNTIKFSDLSANDKYNTALKDLSRQVYTPQINNKIPTRWYYESVTGSYNLEKNDIGKRMERDFPKSQFFTKTDMAAYELAFQGSPAEACKGAQDAYKVFALSLDSMTKPEPKDFKDLVAKKIIFDSILAELNAIGGQGKKAIACYVLAYLATVTCGSNINLDRIWTDQSVSEGMAEDIYKLSREISSYLRKEATSKELSVEMYCRRKANWDELRTHQFTAVNTAFYTGETVYKPKVRTWKVSKEYASIFASVSNDDWIKILAYSKNFEKDKRDGDIIVRTCHRFQTVDIADVSEWDIVFGLRILLRAVSAGCDVSPDLVAKVKAKEDGIYEISRLKKASVSEEKYFEIAKISAEDLK